MSRRATYYPTLLTLEAPYPDNGAPLSMSRWAAYYPTLLCLPWTLSNLITGPLQDIVMTNIVWCIAYTQEVGRGVVYCPIMVQ